MYNDSGADWLACNWLREYPEYHNGGAPVIAARVISPIYRDLLNHPLKDCS